MQALHATHWFQPGSIKPSVSVGPDGQVTIVISVSELISTVHEIVYLGARHISPKELATLTQIHKGDPLEPSLNEQGRKAILRKYQEEQGRWFATVELLEGNKPHDTRVVYRITEGKVVKVRGISFSGNLDAQSGRLKEPTSSPSGNSSASSAASSTTFPSTRTWPTSRNTTLGSAS